MNDDTTLLYDGKGNPIAGTSRRRQIQQLRANARSIVADRMSYGSYGTAYEGRRDYYEILGYDANPQAKQFRARFERDPVAGRVVEFPAEETWRETPTVKDGRDKDAKDDTPFAIAWSEFADSTSVYSSCQAVDTLAGVGRYAVLHIGVAGTDDLSTPITRVNSINDILYLQPYSEENAQIAEWQTDPRDRRFGLPNLYTLKVAHMEGKAKDTFGARELTVHHSRIIHVAEGLLENRVYGRSRLRRVVNCLDDIMKVVGGSAEATWLLMRKGFVLNIDPEFDDMEDKDLVDMQEQFEEYEHGVRRFIKTKGMNVSDLGSEVVDPSGIFDIIITLISVASKIPKRILLGSERGELASSQDASNWAAVVASRQLNYAEKGILRPLIDRLIGWVALPPTESGRYTCVWDPIFKLSETEKTANMKVAAEAYQAIATALSMPPITLAEFRGEHTPFPEQLPKELTDAIAQKQQQAQAAAQAQAQQQAQQQTQQGEDVLQQVSKLDAVKAMIKQGGYTEDQAVGLVRAIELRLSRELYI
jgi:hypothetical protein